MIHAGAWGQGFYHIIRKQGRHSSAAEACGSLHRDRVVKCGDVGPSLFIHLYFISLYELM